jgi:hypothetical protein
MLAPNAERQLLEVRAVGASDFEQIYPLLKEFNNAKMREGDWRDMLFDYHWEGRPERGFALYARDEVVGFLGTIFSKRRIGGREQLVCNTSSWIVKEPYRTASMLLLRPVLALRDCTIVNLTPTQRSYEIFKKLGFKPLESERLLLPPPISLRFRHGSFTSDLSEIAPHLDADERTICRDLSPVDGVHQVVLKCAGRQCYVVATKLKVRGITFAELHYIGDREFFWKNRALAHWALLKTMGAAGVALDRRFAGERTVHFAIRRSANRLYRPQFPDTPPSALDNLYSELMTVKI